MEQFGYQIWVQQHQVCKDYPSFLQEDIDADHCNNMLWNDSEEDGNRSECEEDEGSDPDW